MQLSLFAAALRADVLDKAPRTRKMKDGWFVASLDVPGVGEVAASDRYLYKAIQECKSRAAIAYANSTESMF